MFRLEKVLQNDDSVYILFTKLCKTLLIIFSFYIFSILEKNSIYDLINYKLFLKSNYFIFSINLSLLYFFIAIFFLKEKNYKFIFSKR